MEIGTVIEHVRHVADVRVDGAAAVDRVESAMRSVASVEAWLAGAKAALTSMLAAQVSFPERTIAECTRGSTHEAMKDRERADTLTSTPGLADALDDARVTAGHVGALTRATKPLDAGQRQELFDRVDSGLLDVAAAATLAEWRRRLAIEVKNIQRDDGIERLERQRRAISLRTWTDGEGMWCVSGRFDPVTGVMLSAVLALAELIEGRAVGARPGRPEYVVVIDTSVGDGAGGPAVDWGLPVEVPLRVLAELMCEGRVETVVVRHGVVLHAPGELDLGRATRLANWAQRRALRAWYATRSPSPTAPSTAPAHQLVPPPEPAAAP